MTFHERLLALALGRDKALATVGDIEEEAVRLHAGRAWVLGQVLAQFAAAVRVAAHRRKARTMITLLLALRDARRSIWRFRATSALAVLILTLGIATGTATYAVVDGIVLRPLPYPESDRLVALFGTTTRGRSFVSPADYEAWGQGTTSFGALAAYRPSPGIRLAGEAQAEPVGLVAATASLFDVLQVRPLLGTVFDQSHEAKGSEAVAVISHALWRRRFGGDPAVLGKTVPVSGVQLRIVGVMPPDFAFPEEATFRPGIWRPLVVPAEHRALASGRVSYLHVIGRLKPGKDVAQARADVQRVSDSLAAAYPNLYKEWRPRTEGAIDALTERVGGWMRVVLAAVAGLIVIACANVSNLLLTRSARRARDIALRASLGASRPQLFASLLAESFLLALLALAGGVIAGYWLLELVKHSLPEGIPRADRVALDSRVLFAAALAGLVATLVAGLIPAWQASRTSLADMAREGTSGTPPRGRRVWQHAFLVTQVAVVTVLLTATTLLVGSFVRVLAVDLGFEHRNLIGVRASPPLPEDEKQSEALLRDFNGRALDTLRSVPGVVSVAGLSRSRLPLFGASTSTRITAPGSTAPAAPVDMHLVTPGYFETARIAIVHGRVFSDAERGQRVAIIDALAATQLFGTTDVSGRSVTLPSAGDVHIVGVTTSVRSQGPEGPVNGQLFMPVDDVAAIQMFVVRTSTPAADVAPALEAALAPLLPAGSGKPSISMTGEQYRTMTADRRFNAGLMFALGVMAMVIGVGGIYASTTTLVAQRTREIGIRMALGASASGVVRAITGATTRLLLIGTAIGVGAGWAASGFMQSVIFGITATDLMTYVIPSVIVLAGGVLAALLPARRAARIDPLVTLRTE